MKKKITDGEKNESKKERTEKRKVVLHGNQDWHEVGFFILGVEVGVWEVVLVVQAKHVSSAARAKQNK